MVEAFTAFSSAVRGALGPGWWSNWPLSSRQAVGDVCVVENGQLLRTSTLEALGVQVTAVESPYRDALVLDRNGSVSVTFKAAGSTGPLFSAVAQSEAGAHVTFSSDKAVFAAFSGLRERAAHDPLALAGPLAALYLQGRWEPEWVAVTHVLSATAATVLIAAKAGAEAEVRIGAGLGGATPTVADVAGRGDFARRSALGFEWTADDGCTPFVRVVRIRKPWLRDIDIEYAPRQKVKGLGPAEVPTRVLNAAEQDPQAVVESLDPPTGGDRTSPADLSPR